MWSRSRLLASSRPTVSFFGPSVSLVAKAAFVSSETGQTHGYTTHERWSPAVTEKLNELRALLEREIACVHFADLHAEEGAKAGQLRGRGRRKPSGPPAEGAGEGTPEASAPESALAPEPEGPSEPPFDPFAESSEW